MTLSRLKRDGIVEAWYHMMSQVKDNLKLFHEVQGPVFRSQRALRALPGLLRPRVLPGMRVGGVDILNTDRSGRDDSS